MNAVVAPLVPKDFDPVGRNPFLQLLGANLDEVGDGHARISVTMTRQLENLHGFTHGGVIMALLDAALANAAVSKAGFSMPVVTIDMSVSFLRPGKGKLIAIGRAVGGGSSVCLCEGEVVDENGNMLAKAIGSFKYRRNKTYPKA